MPQTKQHSACDECRRRKLKCQGELPTCSRCEEEHIKCRYSLRKTMGRPRKRQRGEDENNERHNSDASENYSSVNADPLFLPYDNWVIPPMDATNSCSDILQLPFQQNNFASSTDRSSQSSFGAWPSGSGLPPTDFSSSSTTGNSSLSSQDVFHENHQPVKPSGSPLVEGTHNPDADPCTCLSSMYLAAANLESTRGTGFPFALGPLKAALATAKGILVCSKCRQDVVAGCQNITVLHSLLSSTALGFDKLLKDINAEAERAKSAAETKRLQAGDNAPENLHRHTGTADCPGRFSIELEPDEWSKLTRRVVNQNIYRQPDESLTLEALVDATESRQRAWHGGGFPHGPPREFNGAMPDEKEWTCLRMSGQVRRIIAEMPQ